MVKRSPINLKRPGPPRRGRVHDKSYLAWIRTLPCLICDHYRCEQIMHTEAAHVGDRGLGQKCSDFATVPLCGDHHRRLSTSHHALGKEFWAFHRLDRAEIIGRLVVRYPEQA